MDIYISMVHVASGVHHCTSKYIYRLSGGAVCDPVPTGQSAHQCPLCPRGDLAGAMPPGMMPPGLVLRASRSAARCARPLFSYPPPRPPERPTPPPRQLAPHAPFPIPPPWGVKHRRRPPRPGARGLRTARGAWWCGQRGAGGSCCEGHPARAPTVRSPAAPAFTHHNATTITDPQSPSPGPLGPGRFYTNSPTPFGV